MVSKTLVATVVFPGGRVVVDILFSLITIPVISYSDQSGLQNTVKRSSPMGQLHHYHAAIDTNHLARNI